MNNKKIIFMGTPLIAAQHLKILFDNNYQIEAVFTQPPRKKNRGMKIEKSAVHQFALNNNMKVFFPDKLDDSSFYQLKKMKPDLIIVVAYGLILPKRFIDLPKLGSINVHVSLLPRWRGAAPIEYALLNGDIETGISIIKLESKLDAGPILFQKKIKISNEIIKDDLFDKLIKVGTKNLIEFLPKFFAGSIKSIKQDESLATYANKINTGVRKLDFNDLTLNVFNKIRAYSKNPGAWFLLNGQRIKIIHAKISTKKGKPSTILNNQFEIGCKDGSIIPLLLQREGKKVVSLEEFIKGFNFSIGDKINA